MRDLIENKMEELGTVQVFSLLYEPQSEVHLSFLRELTEIGSSEEIDQLLTDFHFSQQVIFDYYEIKPD
jgi:hypothetical protein